MTIYYVYSGATGTGNGSNWANAFTTLGAAYNVEVAGDTLFVAHDHVEISGGSGLVLLSSGTNLLVTKVICVNRLGSVPPVSADRRATAQVSTSGDANLTLSGIVHYDGIIFTCGNSTGAPVLALPGDYGAWARLDNCSLRLGSTGAGTVNLGTATGGNLVDLNNTTLSFTAAAQMVLAGCALRWRNTVSAILGTIPSVLFQVPGGCNADIECIGVDFSAITGAGKVIFGTNTQGVLKARADDCKISAVSNMLSIPQNPASEVLFVRCNSIKQNYDFNYYCQAGGVMDNTTVLHSSGATDGTTPVTWQIDSNSCDPTHPLELPPITVWNDSTDPYITLTVEGIWDNGALPTNQEIWMEVEYPWDTGSPRTIIGTDGATSVLSGAQSSQSAGTGTWTGSVTKFKLDTWFHAQQKGLLVARVKIGKPNTTFYIDPKARVTQ